MVLIDKCMFDKRRNNLCNVEHIVQVRTSRTAWPSMWFWSNVHFSNGPYTFGIGWIDRTVSRADVSLTFKKWSSQIQEKYLNWKPWIRNLTLVFHAFTSFIKWLFWVRLWLGLSRILRFYSFFLYEFHTFIMVPYNIMAL